MDLDTNNIASNSGKKNNYLFAFSVVTSIFFAWGFITALNDILIPYLRTAFELTIFQATLVQFAFFGAYFIGSVIYFIISSTLGDPIGKIGYKNGIIVGLIIAAIGCALFIPASQLGVYAFFLGALFTLGLGLTVLQIAANPYVALLGAPETASSRLNLSQGFNSLATTISPVIGGYLIFSVFHVEETGGAEGVRIPYMMLTGAFLFLALVISFTKLPRINNDDDEASGGGNEALKYNNLVFGIGAIFCYVGAEVAIGSLLINFTILPQILGVEEPEAAKLLALYWGGAMVGRFTGAVAMSEDLGDVQKVALMSIIAVALYGLITLIAGLHFSETLPFLGFAALNVLIALASRGLPNVILVYFSIAAAVLLAVGVMTTGHVAFWAITAIGLFNSIMWSNIFTLSISGLGKNTSQGSSLLVMAILGGALVPPLQGLVADATTLQVSFLMPILCYAYILFFGLVGYKPVRRDA